MSSPEEHKPHESPSTIPINPNYKTLVRVRPSETPTKSMETTLNSIVLKEKPVQQSQSSVPVPPSKEKDEIQYKFSFSAVFDQNTNQESIFKVVNEHCIGKLIEGQNACIIGYGQTNSGKTYTIFGEDEHFTAGKASLDVKKDKKGIVSRSLEGILRKSKDLEEIREFVITGSFYELYLDQVRDLGKAVMDKHNALNGYEGESLEIIENPSNGQFTVKNLTTFPIKHMNDLYDLLAGGFSMREKAEVKGTQISNRAHTILSLSLTQKDRENENLPFVNSVIYFVDLAGSERSMKGGAGSESLKNQENIHINSNLTALGKCLLSIAQSATKNIPYKESKLTKLLQTSLTSISNICFFANVIHADINFEENLNTLRFAERTKNTDLKGRLSMLDDSGFGFGGLGSSDKMIKKLTEEINENKSKLENLQKEYRGKMNELQKILGLDIDLDKLITKPNEKDLKNFKLQREALKELENVKTMKKGLENKIEKQYKKMELLKMQQKEKEDKYYAQISKLKELNKQLKDNITISKVEGDDQIRNLNKQRNEELKHVIINANMKLDEKCHPLLFRQNIMESLQNEKTKLVETKKNKIFEDQRIYQDEVIKLKAQYQAILKSMKESHDLLLNEKNQELQRIIDEGKEYIVKKREERELNKAELLDLNEIALKQHNLIERIESGEFSGGLKSFNIPQKEKPIYPNKLKHFLLHKYLEQNQIKKMSKTAQKEKTALALTTTVESKEQTKAKSDASISKQNFSYEKTTTAMGFDVTHTELARIESDNIDVNVNVNKLNEDYLKLFCRKLQEKLKVDLKSNKEIEERLTICEEIQKTHDITSILKERDEFKSKYLAEWKKNNQARILLESQKRLITSPSFVMSTRSKTNSDFPSRFRSSTSEKCFVKSTNRL